MMRKEYRKLAKEKAKTRNRILIMQKMRQPVYSEKQILSGFIVLLIVSACILFWQILKEGV